MSDLEFWKTKVSKLECECVNKQNEIDKLESECEKIHKQLMETEKAAQDRITKLEYELKAKEEQLKIINELPRETTIDGYKCEIIQTEQGLYISRDRIYEIIDKEKKPLKDRCTELQDRHQQDCIEINRLNTVIDVLIEKHSRLRKQMGL